MLIDQLPGFSAKTNPYNCLLCESIQRAGGTIREYSLRNLLTSRSPDIFHVHWPEYCLSSTPESKMRQRWAKLKFCVWVAKKRGAKLFWTAHNLRPHERLYEQIEPEFYRWWLTQVDGIICLSEDSQRQLIERYPDAEKISTFVVHHGDYRPVITPDITPSSARQVFQFEPNECVVGCIGAIRPYKNVPLLISCFRAIKDPTASLIIAGKCAIESHLAEIKAAIGDDPRIQTKFEILTDAEMQLFTMACDLIVLPYKDILNSGSLLYALSCNRRVLAPKLGSLPELQRDVGADWVNLYEGEFDQAVLENGLVWARSADLGNPNLADYEWNRIGEQTMEAYKSALAR